MASASSDDLATVTVFALSATVAALPQFLPKISDVHHSTPDSAEAADIRVGEVATVAFFIAMGVVAASISGSSDPIVASLVMSVFIVVTYETALRGSFFGKVDCDG